MDNQTTDTALRQIFLAMDADQAHEIREGYYKAVEGLMRLAEALEMEYAKQELAGSKQTAKSTGDGKATVVASAPAVVEPVGAEAGVLKKPS